MIENPVRSLVSIFHELFCEHRWTAKRKSNKRITSLYTSNKFVYLYWLAEWITTASRIILEMLIVIHLITKFAAFYRARRFVIVFTKAATEICSGPDEFSPHHIHLNHILPYTPISPNWSLPFTFSDLNVFFQPLVHSTCPS